MDLTVVFVNYNGADLLSSALNSLPEDIKTIVVDNGSSDDSREFLKKQERDLQLILNDDNRGFGPANNQALRLINSKYVLMLNTDARLKPGSLEAALAYMEEHDDVALLGAQLLHEDGRSQNSRLRAQPRKQGRCRHLLQRKRNIYGKPEYA